MCICMRACVYLHMAQKSCSSHQFDPQMWGATLFEPKNGLVAVFCVFVFCSYSNWRQTEGNC